MARVGSGCCRSAAPERTRHASPLTGGGVIGVAAAYSLASKGIAVALLESGRIAGEQSSRNWGWCRVQNRDLREILLMRQSIELWERLQETYRAPPNRDRVGGLSIRRRSALGAIGESGSDKSTLARGIAGIVPAATGEILLDGLPLHSSFAVRLRQALRRIQFVFQMAETALNPSRTVERIPRRPLRFFHRARGAELTRRVRRLLDVVRLPAAVAERLPGRAIGQAEAVRQARAAPGGRARYDSMR